MRYLLLLLQSLQELQELYILCCPVLSAVLLFHWLSVSAARLSYWLYDFLLLLSVQFLWYLCMPLQLFLLPEYCWSGGTSQRLLLPVQNHKYMVLHFLTLFRLSRLYPVLSSLFRPLTHKFQLLRHPDISCSSYLSQNELRSVQVSVLLHIQK